MSHKFWLRKKEFLKTAFFDKRGCKEGTKFKQEKQHQQH